MRRGRPGPAVLECAIDVWGRNAEVAPIAAGEPPAQGPLDEDAILDAARRLGAAARPFISCGGGAQGAAAEPAPLNAAFLIGLIRVVAYIAAFYSVTVAVDTWVTPHFGDSQLEPLLIKLCLGLLSIVAIETWVRPKSGPSAR